jgi:cytochrome b6-f complex iron-sulfur subunit
MPARLAPEEIPRRDFLGLAGIAAAGLAIFGSIIGMARLTKPSVLPEEGKKVRIGRPDDYAPGSETMLKRQKILILSRDEGIAALSLVCTHLGCIVSKAEEGFSCPCHGSKFGPEGAVLAGPAPRALRWLPVSMAVDGRLVVDGKGEVPAGTFYAA